MKKYFKFILVSLCAALSLTGVLLYFHFKQNMVMDKVTIITIKEDVVKNLAVKIDDIAPGSENNYVINIESNDISVFNISLTFYNGDNPGNLSDYLSLSLKANDLNIEKPLKSILEDKETIDLGRNVKEISLTYKMPIDVGNEAQNSYANFYIDLIAKANKDN